MTVVERRQRAHIPCEKNARISQSLSAYNIISRIFWESKYRLQHTQRAVISRELAGWTSAVELDATDTAYFVLRHIPTPRGDGVPFLDCDFHRSADLDPEFCRYTV